MGRQSGRGRGRTECGNYRPISCNDLEEYKWYYTQILLSRLQRALEPQLMNIQFGFLPNRGIQHCTDWYQGGRRRVP